MYDKKWRKAALASRSIVVLVDRPNFLALQFAWKLLSSEYVTHHIEMGKVAEQTFEKLHKIGRKVTVGHFSDFALNN
jgi:hypothetical protein